MTNPLPMRLAPMLAALVVAAWLGAPASASAERACASPPTADGELQVASPAILGFDPSRLCALLDRVRHGGLNLHSLLVSRHGALAAELYRDGSNRSLYSLWSSHTTFGAADRHDMRSVSKSVVGLLYGILLGRGEVPSLETSVASLYPEFAALAVSPRSEVKIRDLLTMSAGLHWDEPSPVHRTALDDQFTLIFTGSIYRCVFERDVLAPAGTRFVYSGGATAVIADIITRATGRSLTDVARAELFEPLGITQWSWTNDLRGRPMAYAGLRLRPRDMLKLGLLVQNRGVWREREIVPADWIDRATTTRVAASEVYGYGYQWWTSHVDWQGAAIDVTQAIGNGGQRLFIVPRLDLTVVMTAGDYGQPDILQAEDRLFAEIIGAIAPEHQASGAR